MKQEIAEMDNVSKSNELNQAGYSLGIVEQRLVLLAIIEAREHKKLIDANTVICVHAKTYIEVFGVDKTTAYEMLKTATKSLFDAHFTFKSVDKNGNDAIYDRRIISHAGYIENAGYIEIMFTPHVIPLITRLEGWYTSYDIAQIARLDSSYAIRLYELLIQWRKTRKIKIQLTELRFMLGINDNEYQRMEAFKRRVLDYSIKQINEFTDITVKYKQIKNGRFINAFIFTFTIKNQKLIKNKDPEEQQIQQKMSDFVTMSDSQINTFAPKLSRLSSAGSLAKAGEDYSAFESRIKQELKDTAKQKQYHRFLIELGFKA